MGLLGHIIFYCFCHQTCCERHKRRCTAFLTSYLLLAGCFTAATTMHSSRNDGCRTTDDFRSSSKSSFRPRLLEARKCPQLPVALTTSTLPEASSRLPGRLNHVVASRDLTEQPCGFESIERVYGAVPDGIEDVATSLSCQRQGFGDRRCCPSSCTRHLCHSRIEPRGYTRVFGGYQLQQTRV